MEIDPTTATNVMFEGHVNWDMRFIDMIHLILYSFG